jgi:type II secretory pathway component PulF
MSSERPDKSPPRLMDYVGKESTARQAGPIVRQRSWIGRASEELAWIFIAAFVLAVIGGFLMVLTGLWGAGAIGIVVGLIATAVIGTAVASMLERIWAGRSERAVELVAQAVRSGMPLVEFLSTAARSEPEGMARALRRVCDMLKTGVSLPAAFHAAFPRAPSWLGDALDVAPGRSMQPAVMQTQARLARESATQLLRLDGFQGRFALTLAALAGVSLLLFVFVFPSFQKILNDFKTSSWWFETMLSLPAMRLASSPLLLILPGLLLLAWMFSIVLRLARSRSENAGLRLSHEVLDRATWHVPFIGTHARDIAWSAFFDKMASQVSEAVPLDAAANAATHATDNAVARSRGVAFTRALNQGASLTEASQKARLPGVAIGLLGSATHAGQIESVCRLVADRFGERAIRRAELMRAIVPLVITLVLAGLALLLVLTVFLPMMDIINASMPQKLSVMP